MSYFKPRSKETPSSSPFPPKIYNTILDISTIRITAKNPLKNLIREFAFGFLTDYHRFPYYGIQQCFETPFHRIQSYSRHGGRESVRNLLASQADPRDIGVEDSRYIAEKAAGNVARRLSRVQDSFMRGNMYPVCHVALVSKSWWWARRVTLSLLSFPPEKSVPVDTLCTRYSKKYNAWMDLSWKKNEIKYGIMVRVMRIFLHIHISFGHEFIWTIDFGKIKLIKKWSLKIILLLWYTLVRGSRQVLKFLIWIDITMA